ncbi:MAG: phage tail protein [Methanoregula sp.]|uniref:phage tail protein n=1 Tax=Methanoregula sp. TaxID=2052170 RepID=UPI003BB1DAAA
MSGRVDPFHNARFLVEIDGITRAGFHEVQFGSAVTEVIEYREGNDPPVMRQLNGLTQFRPIRLIWGMTGATELYGWYKACSTSGPAGLRKNMAIILLDDNGNPEARWNVVNAWPCRYIPPDLTARECRVAIEMLEIVHEGFTRDL